MENTKYQDVWVVAKPVLRGQVIAINAYFKKKKDLHNTANQLYTSIKTK